MTKPEDLRKPQVWRAVARKLAEWHATLPITSTSTQPTTNDEQLDDHDNHSFPDSTEDRNASKQLADALTPNKPVPNVWTVMQKWIYALPSNTEEERAQRALLQGELEWLVQTLGDVPGINSNALVFGHCDLLSGNVIVENPEALTQLDNTSLSSASVDTTLKVNFIDYEYGAPAPAAFDIANHFAEWGGFDCDFNVLPTRSQRKDFLENYLQSYNTHLSRDYSAKDFAELFSQVDLFRGVPGFYWGIWALIQALISQIDFDYASYAQVRLGEYWAWKAEINGSRAAAGSEMPLRERRWAKED